MSDNALERPEKMKLTSMDVAQENRARLKQLFPEVFTEDRIDFEQLRRVMGDWVEPGKERYGLNWPGKAECMKIIQAPSIATLKPARDESVDFDTTENLFIEGDNLEVLKLLQKAYFGKVKMIYIDPPYNTGKEFIYPDKYRDNLDTYLAYTGQVDGEGKRFATNTDAGGRFHANWLNMMYPRLYLARNLLSEEGVIFISIDDNEQSNLKALCDTVFGERNFITCIMRKRKKEISSDSKNVSIQGEYVLAYGKSASTEFLSEPLSEEYIRKSYKEPTDEFPDGKWRPVPITVSKGLSGGGYRYEVITPTGKTHNRLWAYPPEGYERLKSEKRLYFGTDGNGIPQRVIYAHESKGQPTTNYWDDAATNKEGKKEILSIFGDNIFDTPKPTKLIERLMSIISHSDDIILDFFSGSCATAQAVIQLNKQDDKNRKFLMVQLPEKCGENSEVVKAGYRTIADIGKERIRRVANAISEKTEGELDLGQSGALDLGFKVFKLSRSNFKIWDGDAENAQDLARQLELHVNHIDPASGPEDILYELLLKAGFELTTRIERRTMAGKDVYAVADGALLVCLDQAITPELIDALADADPLQVICLDQGFKGNDQLKTNAVQTFKARAAACETEIVFRTV